MMEGVKKCIWTMAVATSCFSIGAARAQISEEPQTRLVRLDRSEGDAPRTGYKTETDLALISFTFFPVNHRRPDDLRLTDISIREDGVFLPAALLEGGSEPRTVPTDVVLLFDCGKRFRENLNAQLLPPGILDELPNVRLSVYGFSDFVYRLIKPSRNMTELQKAMSELSAIPYDGVRITDPVIQTMRSAVSVAGSRPRIMIIFSGGTSRLCQMPKVHAKETIQIAQELGIALYPVVVQPPTNAAQDASISGHTAFHHPLPRPAPTFAAATSFLSLGPATGGTGFARFAAPKEVLSEVFRHVSAQARAEFVAGFYPSTSGIPASHKIEVVLKNKRLGEIRGGVRSLVQ